MPIAASSTQEKIWLGKKISEGDTFFLPADAHLQRATSCPWQDDQTPKQDWVARIIRDGGLMRAATKTDAAAFYEQNSYSIGGIVAHAGENLLGKMVRVSWKFKNPDTHRTNIFLVENIT